MLVIICGIIGGGVGTLIGAKLKTTESGEKIDKNLQDAFDKMKDIKGHINFNNVNIK